MEVKGIVEGLDETVDHTGLYRSKVACKNVIRKQLLKVSRSVEILKYGMIRWSVDGDA